MKLSDDLAPATQQTLSLDGPAGAMEVLVDMPAARPRGVALVAHPHPKMGGSAAHKVPHWLARGAQREGWVALRPNFRGVGGSAGPHDEGDGEADDLHWLATQARQRWPGLPLALIGFSFGAFVLARVADRLAREQAAAEAVVLAGFPVGEVPGGRVYAPAPLTPGSFVVHGERDERVALQPVMDWCGEQNRALVVVPGADHFFTGRLPLLRELVNLRLRACLSDA